MRITVLGKSPAWQDAGGACTGYLVQEGGTAMLLDCGSGVFGKLRTQIDYTEIDAVVVSHLHADHILDLVPFASGLAYGPRRGSARARPALHAPAGAREAFGQVCAGGGMNADHVATAFALREYDPSERLDVGALRVRFCPVPHFLPANAVEIVSADTGGRLTFSSDSGPSEALSGFARDTDLLLIEATVPRPEDPGPRGHLTPEEAGRHGARAGARRVVLTHVSDELEANHVAEEGARGFGRAVELAYEGAVYEL